MTAPANAGQPQAILLSSSEPPWPLLQQALPTAGRTSCQGPPLWSVTILPGPLPSLLLGVSTNTSPSKRVSLFIRGYFSASWVPDLSSFAGAKQLVICLQRYHKKKKNNNWVKWVLNVRTEHLVKVISCGCRSTVCQEKQRASPLWKEVLTVTGISLLMTMETFVY